MRSIKNLAAMMLLAVTVSMSAQTGSAKGIIITDRTDRGIIITNGAQSTDDLVGLTDIILTDLLNFGIIITDVR
jgi:hypothetical protein